MKSLWVVDFVGLDMPEPRTTPNWDDLDIIVADTHFVVVSATMTAVEIAIADYPYWRIVGHPAAGKWIATGGNQVYIDDNCEVVASAEAVCASLGIDVDENENADDILINLNRVF